MTTHYLTNDMMFSSRVASLARQFALPMTVVATPEALLERCEGAPAELVLLDLSLPGMNVGELVARLRACSAPPRAVVAYAPHVHENLLAAATGAGCTEVLTRGQFHGQMERVLKQYGCGA